MFWLIAKITIKITFERIENLCKIIKVQKQT